MFDRVHEHLADDGLFVFDVNTVGRLRRLWQGPAFAADFGENTMIMDVLPAAGSGDNGAGELSTWTVRIFERVAGDTFRLHAERIPELGVPLATIREALAANFDLLEETGLDGGPATDESSRAFFVCRHRARQVGGAWCGSPRSCSVRRPRAGRPAMRRDGTSVCDRRVGLGNCRWLVLVFEHRF